MQRVHTSHKHSLTHLVEYIHDKSHRIKRKPKPRNVYKYRQNTHTHTLRYFLFDFKAEQNKQTAWNHHRRSSIRLSNFHTHIQI